MDKFTKLTGVAAPMPMQNIDTDKVIPARFLKTIKRTGLGVHLFDALRYLKDGSENPDFVLNQEPYRKAEIIIAYENFGCGSSREHAPWALLDFGIRCIIAPDFADIFFNNSFKNGILPIRLPRAICEQLVEDSKAWRQRAHHGRSGASGRRAAERRGNPLRDRSVPQASAVERIGRYRPDVAARQSDRRLRDRPSAKPALVAHDRRLNRKASGGTRHAGQQETADPAR